MQLYTRLLVGKPFYLVRLFRHSCMKKGVEHIRKQENNTQQLFHSCTLDMEWNIGNNSGSASLNFRCLPLVPYSQEETSK